MRSPFPHENQLDERRGFTLLELLVVIALIGILASVVLASLNMARTRAEESRIKVESQEILKALELYYTDFGEYPDVDQVVELSNPGNEGIQDELIDTYLGGVPEEAVRFAYCSTVDNRSMLLAVNTNYDIGPIGSDFCHIIRGPAIDFDNNGCAFDPDVSVVLDIDAGDPCTERF
jgi:type II secretion system protein G